MPLQDFAGRTVAETVDTSGKAAARDIIDGVLARSEKTKPFIL